MWLGTKYLAVVDEEQYDSEHILKIEMIGLSDLSELECEI